MKNILIGSFRTLYYLFMNILTVFVGLFIHRDTSVILMGSWFGRRFGGNPRYLFQYLSENKEIYRLKRVVWVTRSRDICKELRRMGYETYMMKSFQGIYYHFKAGIHIANNACCNFNSAKVELSGDIMGELSIGACKVYLAHAVAVSQNDVWENGSFSSGHRLAWKIFNTVSKISWIKHFMLVGGGWDHAVMICASNEIMKNNAAEGKNRRLVVTGFPEFCKPLKYTKREKEILKLLHQKPKTILYVPTFRTSEKTGFIHPLNDPIIRKYLRENNYFWVDKMHPAASAYSYMEAETYDADISLCLEPDFDLNIIVHHVDVLISDYSSVIHKAIYFHKPMINYLADMKGYRKYDAGLGRNFTESLTGICVYSSGDLMKAIETAFSNEYFDSYGDIYQKKYQYFFDGRKSDYKEIWDTICQAFDTRDLYF